MEVKNTSINNGEKTSDKQIIIYNDETKQNNAQTIKKQ